MRLRELASLIGGELRGDGDVEINSLSGLGNASDSDLSFLTGGKFLKDAEKCGAACILVPEFFDSLPMPQIKVADPEFVFFTELIERFRPRPPWPAGVSGQAHVDASAVLGEGVSVMSFAYVSDNVSIGRDTVICPGVFIGSGSRLGSGCLIYPNVSIMDSVTLGDRAIVHAGTVIGSDGYSFMQRQGRHIKKPQQGGVLIGDDVEIGANCAIDRATIGNTVIGDGVKLDNLVHVAHNVTVGQGSLLTAQVGIAGSSKLGKYVVLAGQAGVKDHMEVADGAVFAAKSGVIQDVKEGGAYAGMPAIPMQGWLRSSAAFAKLPETLKRLRALERRLDEMEKENEKSRGSD